MGCAAVATPRGGWVGLDGDSHVVWRGVILYHTSPGCMARVAWDGRMGFCRNGPDSEKLAYSSSHNTDLINRGCCGSFGFTAA